MSTDNGISAAAGREAGPVEADLATIADAFVHARLRGEALAAFPGRIPGDLEAAYRVQDLAIAQWPDRVVGWKVGYIAAARRDASGDDRLLGPIFARGLQHAGAGDLGLEVFTGGFGAVEAEYVLRLQADAAADKLDWTAAEAAAIPASLYLGVEVASSPLVTINELGPMVVVSEFGNNNGLVVGAEIADWQSIPEQALSCETFIDDVSAGRGGATSLPGGLRAAFAFALSRSARRGRPLKSGDWIATGNATGIHDIVAGQRARVAFAGYGAVEVLARPARPVVAPDDGGDAR